MKKLFKKLFPFIYKREKVENIVFNKHDSNIKKIRKEMEIIKKLKDKIYDNRSLNNKLYKLKKKQEKETDKYLKDMAHENKIINGEYDMSNKNPFIKIMKKNIYIIRKY